MPCHVLSAPSGGHWQLCYAAPSNVLASFLRQAASPPPVSTINQWGRDRNGWWIVSFLISLWSSLEMCFVQFLRGYLVPPAITCSLTSACFTFLHPLFYFPFLHLASGDHLSDNLLAPKSFFQRQLWGELRWRQTSTIQVCVYVCWYMSFIYI